MIIPTIRCGQLCGFSQDAGIYQSFESHQGILWPQVNQIEFDYWARVTIMEGVDNDRDDEHARAFHNFQFLTNDSATTAASGDGRHYDLGHVLEAGAGPFSQVQ